MRSRSSGRRVLCMVCAGCSCVVILIWHLSLLFGRSYTADFDIICEVARRVAGGGRLYVDAVDARGPLMYAPMVFRWATSPSWDMVFWRSVVTESLLNVVTVGLAARVVYETHEDDEHVIVVVALGCLASAVLVALVGAAESETRVIPCCLFAVLLVLREWRGVSVHRWQWLVVGCFAGYALWTKFPLCGVFLLVLVYGAFLCGPRRMVGPFLVAMVGVVAVSVVACLFVVRFSDVQSAIGAYLFSSGGGYFWYMVSRGVSHLMYGGTAQAVGMLVRWVFDLCIGVASFVFLARHAGCVRNTLVWCCVALPIYAVILTPFPVYYRSCLVVFVVLSLGVGDWSFVRFSARSYAGAITAFVLFMVVAFIIGGWRCVACAEFRDGALFSDRVRRELGGDDSICAGYFGELWIVVDLGMETPYPTPAPNNLIGAFDELESDVRNGRWRWLCWNVKHWDKDIPEEGDMVPIFGQESVCVVSDSAGNVLLRLVDVDEGNLLHSRPIAWPDPWVPVA